MKNKVFDITIISVGIVFLCWYLPVAFYNVYACDDYWFGSNVRMNGFWGNQLFYYMNWEGSYTHTFLASLPHIFSGKYIPFGVNMFSLVLFLISLSFFLRTYYHLSSRRGVECSLYLLSFFYLCTKGDSEIRFWVCANITYISEMSFFLIFIALYHKLEKEVSKTRLFLVVLCLILIGGSKLTFIIYTISCIIIHDILFERAISKINILVYSLIVVFVAINLASPGNYVRLKEETMPNDIDVHMGLIESIFYRLTEMKSFVLNTLFLLPIAAQCVNRYSFKKERVLIALVIFGSTFVVDSIVMYICFHDSGPLRVYFVAEVIFALVILFCMNHFYTRSLYKYCYSRHIIILFVFLLITSHIFIWRVVPQSIEFSEKARERDKYVMSCSAKDTLMIKPLPSSYLMLSYFSNDVTWLERIYLPYFHKNNKFVFLGTPNSVEK